jgi:hypothetical protein
MNYGFEINLSQVESKRQKVFGKILFLAESSLLSWMLVNGDFGHGKCDSMLLSVSTTKVINQDILTRWDLRFNLISLSSLRQTNELASEHRAVRLFNAFSYIISIRSKVL